MDQGILEKIARALARNDCIDPALDFWRAADELGRDWLDDAAAEQFEENRERYMRAAGAAWGAALDFISDALKAELERIRKEK